MRRIIVLSELFESGPVLVTFISPAPATGQRIFKYWKEYLIFVPEIFELNLILELVNSSSIVICCPLHPHVSFIL